MSTVNVERVGAVVSPGKKLGTTTFTGRNGILCRYFYFAMSLLLAAIVVTGFKRTVNQNLFHPAIPRPFILWVHASAFSAWVIFFIAQSTLVRVRKVSWHRSIGWFGAGLATVMVPLGVATAIVMARFDMVQLHLPDADAFLSIPFYDMIAFGVSIALAIYWRTKPELHRRLVFIATCGLMDAAFGRFDYLFNNNLFFPCLDLLILLGVARDLLVDRRVHKVYLYAVAVVDRWPKPRGIHVAKQSLVVAGDHARDPRLVTQVSSHKKNPRPSGAWTGHPLDRALGSDFWIRLIF